MPMKKTNIAALTLLLLFIPIFAISKVTEKELKNNIKKTSEQLESAQQNISGVKENIKKIRRNLAEINTLISAKKGVKERSIELMKNYGTRISQAKAAKREFQVALKKDQKELTAVRRDLVRTKKKLKALLAAEQALKESIQISEESLEKIFGRSQNWEMSKSKSLGALQEIDDDIKVLLNKRVKQKKLLREHTSTLKRWLRNYKVLEETQNKFKAQLQSK